MEQWHVIYTQPKKELWVNRQLEDRGLDIYFPVLQFDRGYGRGIRLEPFFPHYLFVKVDLATSHASGLRWLAGVRSIVEVGNEPAVVPDAVIEALHQRLDAHTKKVLRPSEWLFQPGQKVAITSGPLKGFEAVFQKGLSGEQRVQVLLDFLGNQVRTTVRIDQLAMPTAVPV
jgi:transcriptional antiterminator RfaH